jgi:hypothetical protein
MAMEGEAKATEFRGAVETELRRICRNADTRWARVSLTDRHGRNGYPWLWLGESSLWRPGNGTGSTWWLTARLGPRAPGEGDPTDFEHDPAYACRMPLIGMELGAVHGHHTFVSAWVDPDNPEEFRVPLPGYDPREHPDAVMCEDENCLEVPPEDGGGPHVIVPEGSYVPPFEERLYRAVRGKRVEIVFHLEGLING